MNFAKAKESWLGLVANLKNQCFEFVAPKSSERGVVEMIGICFFSLVAIKTSADSDSIGASRTSTPKARSFAIARLFSVSVSPTSA